MKTAKEIQQKWDEILKERTKSGEVIEKYKISKPQTEHDKNQFNFHTAYWEHLSSYMNALEWVLYGK